MKKLATISVVVVAITCAPTFAQDGVGLGGTLRAVQDSPTSFGNATGGGQDSAGGGELDAMWGDISGSTLNLAISGNIEGNFNKAWIFFDTKAGGENTLDNMNTDNGCCGEIQQMAGLTFDSGFDADYAIRIEVGSGFYGINFADLVPNTSGSIWNGGGFEALPDGPNTGGFGVTWGWDNSNVLGVTSSDASGALTATTGLEFSIDMASAFGDGSLTSLKVMALYGNGGGDFMSNQVLPGVGLDGGTHLGTSSAINFGNFAGDQFAVIPEPGSIGMLALGGLVLMRRRRRR